MKNKKERCPHCDASMMTNKYTLNTTLLGALSKMQRAGNRKIQEMEMTKSEYANYTKLKYWGFITRLDDGIWRVTENGYKFLLGERNAPREVVYFRDKVLEEVGNISVWDIVKTRESKQKYRDLMEPLKTSEDL